MASVRLWCFPCLVNRHADVWINSVMKERKEYHVKNNGKKIDALIRGIGKRSVSLREAVQACAVLIVEHAKDTNDCSRALALVTAVGMASDRVKLIQWFGMVSPINITFTADVTKRRVGLRKNGMTNYAPFDLPKARSLSYWTVGTDDDKQTEELTSASVNTAILKLAKRLQSNLDKGRVAANDTDSVVAKIAALRQAAVAVAA